MDLTPVTNLVKFQEQEAIDYSIEAVRKLFPGVEPTEKEFYAGYLKSFELALQRLKKERIEQKRLAQQEEVKRMWSYEECLEYFNWASNKIAASQNYKFKVDAFNEPVIRLLCLYFSNDPLFETYKFAGVPYSLKKGICLQSPTRGTGKTNLLRAFCLNKKQGFVYKHVGEIRDDFSYKGFGAVELMTQPLPVSPVEVNFYQSEMGIMYDEMFDEGMGMHKGHSLNISQHIFNRLYDYNKGKNWFYKFHMTTNYDGDAVEAKCGKSVRSRIPEMFNLIKLEGPDRRQG